jgi:hypothetical protein
MFCNKCRYMIDDASRLCVKSGNDTPPSLGSAGGLKSNTSMLRSPYEETRQVIQLGALLYCLLAALHLYELCATTNGMLRFGAAVGSALFAEAAWSLWRRNSFAAALAALVVLCLESSSALASVATRIVAPETWQSGAIASGYLIMLAIGVFAAGCNTLRATARMRRMVVHPGDC